MSKSLGNGVDPLKVIEEYGSDALRFSVILNTSPGNDSRYLPEKLESAKNFANKVWNASKFVLMNLNCEEKDIADCDVNDLAIEDKWILNKLNKTIKTMEDNMDKYELGLALQEVYDFIWDEFCDWYIEMVKPRLYYSESSKDKLAAQYTLNYVLKSALKLLHPFMPFVSEKIYLNLANVKDSIMLEEWPIIDSRFSFDKEQTSVENIKEIIVGIRNVRSKMNIHPTKKSDLLFVSSDSENILASSSFIKKLGFGENIKVYTNKSEISGNNVCVVAPNMEVYLPLSELINKDEELERINKEREKLSLELTKLSSMLNNQGFLTKAPSNKVEEIKTRTGELQEMISNLDNQKESILNM
jgi:valyl-tRNA synthetase